MTTATEAQKEHRVIDRETYLNPPVPTGVDLTHVPLVEATNESLKEFGCIFEDPDEFTVENGRFEIVPWPQPGWRALDPGTGVEGGTTEGGFRLFWENGHLMGENLALATKANQYLLAFGSIPGHDQSPDEVGKFVHVWFSDYHADGGQLFFSTDSPIVANLAPAVGDDVKPSDFTAFYCAAGTGLYIHPGVWHNAVYVTSENGPATIFGRQGRVHPRVSVRWADEFNTVLRVPLTLP